MTQKAIEEVDNEIQDLKESLKPKSISSNHKEVLRLGEEVRELKNQVMYVTGKWRECQEKLEFYEERYENEMIQDSIEMDRESDRFRRYNKYVKYAPANFSKNFHSRNKRNSRFY